MAYEYKCVPTPTGFSVSSQEGEAKAAQGFAKFITQNCNDGWEFVSMGQITVTTVPEPPGCLPALLAMIGLVKLQTATDTPYNMLVFRRQK